MKAYRVQTAVRLTAAQHEKLLALGGSAWMRAAIDRAGEVAQPYTKRATKPVRRKGPPSSPVLSPDELAVLTARLTK